MKRRSTKQVECYYVFTAPVNGSYVFTFKNGSTDALYLNETQKHKMTQRPIKIRHAPGEGYRWIYIDNDIKQEMV